MLHKQNGNNSLQVLEGNGLHRLEAMIQGQADVLEMISNDKPIKEVLEAIVKWVEQQSNDGLLASILFVDSEYKVLKHGAGPSLPDAYNKIVDGLPIGEKVGSCGTAAHRKQAVIVEDIASDPLWADFKETAMEFGLHACWSSPLIARDGQVYGTFAIYYREPRKPTTDDLQLIRLVSRTAVIAIEHSHVAAERQRLQENEKLALQKAEATRQHFYELLMRTPAIIAVHSGPNHVIELANARYLQTVGNRPDIIGKPAIEAIPELAGQGLIELLDNVYHSNVPFVGYELPVYVDRKGNGKTEEFFYNFIYQPLDNDEGVVERILVHAVDVTEPVLARRKTEASIKELVELKDANLNLVRVNKNLEQFAYMASHDLQEPLRKIKLFSSILSARFPDGNATNIKYLNKITDSVGRMQSLINDLLDFSRTHKASQGFEKVDLNNVVAQVKEDFDLAIKEKDLELWVDTLPVLDAIPVQMRQLFHNLVGNAIKFSRNNVRPKIAITCRIMTKEELHAFPDLHQQWPHCEIIVKDNGIGFKQELAEQIFVIFQRLHNRDEFEGTGIGLALCQKVMNNHHGHIYAEGVEQEGAAFHAIFPMMRA